MTRPSRNRPGSSGLLNGMIFGENAIEENPMTRTHGWNWVGIVAFVCGAAVIIPSLVALALSLLAVVRIIL